MSIYAVDIDGTLCETSRTWLEPTDDPERSVIHFPHPAPIQRNIDAVNKLVAAGHIIILHTSRTGNYDRERTVDWLDCHEVSYHRIHFDKPLADFYVDDKAWSADSFAFEVGVTDAARDREGIRSFQAFLKRHRGKLSTKEIRKLLASAERDRPDAWVDKDAFRTAKQWDDIVRQWESKRRVLPSSERVCRIVADVFREIDAKEAKVAGDVETTSSWADQVLDIVGSDYLANRMSTFGRMLFIREVRRRDRPDGQEEHGDVTLEILSELRHERDRQRTLELRYSVAMDRALALDAPMIADANRVGRDACGAKACIIDRAISLYLQSAS